MNKILITGNLGYIGIILTEDLLKENYDVIGVDTDFYCDRRLYEFNFKREFIQLKKDIRKIEVSDIKDVDSIIHLSALSNDPLGELNPRLTDKINYEASLRLAQLAKKAKVKRFLFSSSCSIYGASANSQLTEKSQMNPLSSYAHSKVNFEIELMKLADEHFSPVILRNGTAYGVSPNIRFDIVVNNLMGWAYTMKEIRILSDGRAWRPIVHIKDISHAFIASLKAPREEIHNEIFNVGINSENYQVKEIAYEIQKLMSECEIKVLGKLNPDERNYHVNFDKISENLRGFKPAWNLKKGIKELYDIFKEINLSYEVFQDKNFTRIKQLNYLLNNKRINSNLFWETN